MLINNHNNPIFSRQQIPRETEELPEDFLADRPDGGQRRQRRGGRQSGQGTGGQAAATASAQLQQTH